MDDLQQKISQMLADPESMEQIRNMATSLFSGGNDSEESDRTPTYAAQDAFADPKTLMKVANILKRNVDDDSAKLLFALKPHLGEERRKRVDKAVKILKLVSLIPLFKEQGILDF